MPQFDLSTLSGPELRGLLDTTRQRGQAVEAYRILQEMAARRARDGGETAVETAPTVKPARRVISVDLGDPLEKHDEPLRWRTAEAEAPGPAATGDFDIELRLTAEDRRPRRAPRPPKPPPEPRRHGRAPRRRRWPAALFVGGIALGAVVGGGMATDFFSQPAPAMAVFPAAPMLRPEQIAQVTPLPPAQPAVVAPAPAPPAEPAPVPGAVDLADAAASASTEASALQIEVRAADEPKPAEAKPAAEPSATELAAAEPAPKACPGASSPADRTICEDPRLQRLQHELRHAYAEALQAHADRATLRQRQLAWADARKDVDDPVRLARLYEQRIRKLNAAAAAARAEQ